MGSLVDNVRFGTLICNFPQFLPPKKSQPLTDIWEKKTALNLNSYKSSHEKLDNPKHILIIFPRVEEWRENIHLSYHKKKEKPTLMLFNNLSQKVSESFLLYNQFPVTGLDDKEMALKRIQFIKEFLNHHSLKDIISILTSPNECWKNLLKQSFKGVSNEKSLGKGHGRPTKGKNQKNP
jgi:hypothetical protein